MGLLLKVIGACVIAEKIGNTVESISEHAHAAERDKAIAAANANKEIVRMQENTKRENARLRAEIARMHEETERSNARIREETERVNARIRAEAKVAAERIRTSGMVATASIMYGRDNNVNAGNTTFAPDFVQTRNADRLSGDYGQASLILGSASIQGLSDPEPRFCNNCGSKLMPGSFFCRNCGKRVR